MAPRRLLRSPHEFPEYGMEAIVYSSPAELSGEKMRPRFEFAGVKFHAWQRRVCLGEEEALRGRTGSSAPRTKRGGGDVAADEGEDDEDEMRRKEYERRRAEKRRSEGRGEGEEEEEEDEEDVNYYELLGIGHVGLNASDKQIKKAYQAAVLKSHPDKIASSLSSKEEVAKANEAFGRIQKAYEVLSNPAARRGYDSNFKFDDAVPTGFERLESEAAFFRLYGPVFESNARFSEVKPVPLLGTPDDSLERVRAFYAFWRGFKSWREFSKFDEFSLNDLETAECREERRWMTRKNEAERERRKKKEYARIAALVERAYANDPRVARAKSQAERAKLELKQQREETVQRRAREAAEAEEAARRLESAAKEEEARRREEERRVKAENKARIKRAAKRVRELATGGEGETGRLLLESAGGEALLANQTDPLTLERLVGEMEAATPEEAVRILARAVEEVEAARVRAEREREERAAALHAAGEEDRRQAKKAAAAAWTPAMVSALSKGLAKHPGGTRNRWMVISNYMTTCGFAVAAEECANYANNVAKSALAPSASSSLKAAPAFVPPKVEVVDREAALPAGVTPLELAAAATPSSSSSSSENQRPWTAEETKALQAALAEFPASMEKNERWGAIASRVPGRTKKECAARFNVLRERALGGQPGPGPGKGAA